MKKILSLLFLSLVVSGFLFSATNKELNEKPFVEWEFKPTVNTFGGYNIDLGRAGMEGEAKLELTAKIWGKANVEFSQDQKPYGYIKVKDLEIKVGSGDKKEDYNSTSNLATETKDGVTTATNTEPFTIKWGGIEGAVYVGPVYINLAHDGHNDQGFIDGGLDDGDLSYSVINYSVVSAEATAELDRTNDGTTINSLNALEKNDLTGGSSLASDLAKSNNAISVGVKFDNLLDVRVGFTSVGSYKKHSDYYPYQISLYFELLAVKNLILALKATVNGGAGNDLTANKAPNPIMSEGNPITAGLIVGYGIPIGTFTFTPLVGFELQVEKLPSFGNLKLVREDGTTLIEVAAGSEIDTIAYQVAAGFVFDWNTLGNKENESDHLSAPGKDVKVTDGVSLGVLYGSMPNGFIRSLSTSYIGVKLALWDSQDTDKPGIMPLKMGLILNWNYLLPTKFPAEDGGTSGTAGWTSINLKGRHDVGALLETSITLGYFKPYLNVIARMLDLTNEHRSVGDDKVTSFDSTTNKHITYNLFALPHATDLRVKLGLDLVNLVPKTTFKIWWESGDLLRADVLEANRPSYTSPTFYTLKNNFGIPTAAKYGYVALGAEIAY